MSVRIGGATDVLGNMPCVDVFAGLLIGLALMWYPAAGYMRLKARVITEMPNKPTWADERPLRSVGAVGNRMWQLWWVRVSAIVVAVVLIVAAVA